MCGPASSMVFTPSVKTTRFIGKFLVEKFKYNIHIESDKYSDDSVNIYAGPVEIKGNNVRSFIVKNNNLSYYGSGDQNLKYLIYRSVISSGVSN